MGETGDGDMTGEGSCMRWIWEGWAVDMGYGDMRDDLCYRIWDVWDRSLYLLLEFMWDRDPYTIQHYTLPCGDLTQWVLYLCY